MDGLDDIGEHNAINLYQRAAAGGFERAQRHLALISRHPSWANYLISKGDLPTMTFYGATLRTYGATEEARNEGQLLIESAAARGYPEAQSLL
ncbi:MAG: hypothetical protein JJU10_12430 [Idiomarina sp.]|nr:hypothetical protein [Idiomarina sp.]